MALLRLHQLVCPVHHWSQLSLPSNRMYIFDWNALNVFNSYLWLILTGRILRQHLFSQCVLTTVIYMPNFLYITEKPVCYVFCLVRRRSHCGAHCLSRNLNDSNMKLYRTVGEAKPIYLLSVVKPVKDICTVNGYMQCTKQKYGIESHVS